jgi:hypothetical protein
MNVTEPDFTVNHVALHLINKKNNELKLSDHEIDRTVFGPAENKAIDDFFGGHLNTIWAAAEGNAIRAASFLKESQIKTQYQAIKSKSSLFLEESANMARGLFEVAPKNSSAGLLMALWFTARGQGQPFLALFKMDPGSADKITLRSKGNQLLLDLAVEHIEQALPDPDSGNRVLKWAITPHPTRPYDVKIKDSQSTPDPAIYFMKFLGCEARKTERQQVGDLLRILPPTALNKLVPKIEAASLAGRVSFDSIEKSNTLTKHQLEALDRGLVTAGSRDLNISSKAIETAKLGYRLSNEIVIKGPLAAMKGVTIEQVGKNDYEFRIRTTSYEKFYE